MPPSLPVTAIVLNHNGRHHLAPCLDALRSAAPAGLVDVVVADNGSNDGSADLVAQGYPEARWLSLHQNLGFAAGNNAAAEAVPAEWLLFLNNDTAVAPDFLAPLWATVQGGVACAGARLVRWDGRRLDFDGGGASFSGHGHALGYGQPLPRGPSPPRPSLFASGAAMLVHRETFLSLGGFDPAYFAYYEDVDLGWRLWLAGHQVRHVPGSVVRHRHHGTVAAVSGRAARMYEANALATVVKAYEDVNLARVLPAALALAAVRAGADPGVVEGAVPRPGGAPPLPVADWPGWRHLAPLTLDWPSLWAARARVQASRRRLDVDVLPLLLQPFAPVPANRTMAAATARAVTHFKLRAVAGLQTAPAPAPGAARRIGRLGEALRAGGARAVRREIRDYLAWRRSRGA